MVIPADLLDAISSPQGGKVALVLGAGCSIESPTGVPAAARWSTECHDRLVSNGHLANGDCPDPSDLSCLADTVYDKHDHQQQLVVRQMLQLYPLKLAKPNLGYRLAAALLREGAINSVITLNFDLALTHALVDVDAANEIGIIDGPDDLWQQRAFNVYYLHRNANETDLEAWVLRTGVINTEWRDHWEDIIATKVMTAPVVVFAGLGDPAAVLIESTTRIRGTTPIGSLSFQVDPLDAAESAFFAALKIEPEDYIQLPWCEFMRLLSQRVVLEQLRHLSTAVEGHANDNDLDATHVPPVLAQLDDTDLLALGALRHMWLFQKNGYSKDEPRFRPLIADLLLGLALLANTKATQVGVCHDGLVELRQDGVPVACLLLASGQGSRSRLALEPAVNDLCKGFRGRSTMPTAVLVAGTGDIWDTPVSLPAHIADDTPDEDIVSGHGGLTFIHVAELRRDPHQAIEMVA